MNIDNLSIEEIEALEMQKALMKFSPSGLHPDRTNVENLDENQIKALEAQVLEKNKQINHLKNTLKI